MSDHETDPLHAIVSEFRRMPVPAVPDPSDLLSRLNPDGAGSDATRSYREEKPPAPSSAGTLPPGLAEHRDYEIVRELGGGGMGVVYLAHSRLMGRDEVLKVISPTMLERPDALDRFQREIRAVARLRHPNIVAAYTAFRCGESLVFAMEYVEGLDLARMVQARGPLPVANACHYVLQAALGLQHAHEHGMVHRDIKPSNLMLSRDRDRALIKVLDFGLAKAERENRGRDFGPVGSDRDGPAGGNWALTAAGQFLGTPGFVAPEQIDDAQAADIRADIYSLGCTLYYLLSGSPPFAAETPHDVLQAHHSTEACPLNQVRPEVPVDLAALVAKMMAKDPGQRFQTPSDLAQALTPFTKRGDRSSNRTGAGTPRVTPTMMDRPGAGAAFATTQPGTDAEAPGARIAWVWPSLAAGVLALGLGTAWLGGFLRLRTPEGRPAVAHRADAPAAGQVPEMLEHPVRAPSPAEAIAPPAQPPAPPATSTSVAHPPASPSTRVKGGERPPDANGPVRSAQGPVRNPVETEAEQVLAKKGLMRSGLVYILDDSETRMARLRGFAARAQQLQGDYDAIQRNYAALQADYQRAESEKASLEQSELQVELRARTATTTSEMDKDSSERQQRERERAEARRELARKKSEVVARMEGIIRQGVELEVRASTLEQLYLKLQADAQTLEDEARRRYQRLAADEAVQSAIRDLNKGRARDHYTLGPVESPEDYRKGLRRNAYFVLLSKDLVFERGHLHVARGAARHVARLTNDVLAAQHKLASETSALEGWIERRKRLDAELARPLGVEQRSPLVAERKMVQGQIDRLSPKGHEAATAVEQRGEFVHRVVMLRLAIAALQSRIKGLEEDADIQTALRELENGLKPVAPRSKRVQGQKADAGGRRLIFTPPHELEEGQKVLEKVEPLVETTTVPLLKDGDRYRVDARLNGRTVASPVVDPSAEATWLPARLASAAGVQVPAGAPSEDLALDGRTVSARRATLASVQVGRYMASDSPCLVLRDVDEEVVPRLGRPFLDRFGGTIDAATETLILGEVKASAFAHDPHPTKGGNVPPHQPARGAGSDRTGQPSVRARG